MPKRNIISALFDIRPVGDDGKFNFDLVNNLKPTVDLTSFRPETQEVKSLKPETIKSKNFYQPEEIQVKADTVKFSKDYHLKELEKKLSENIDLSKEISKFGGQLVSSSSKSRPRTVPVAAFNRSSDSKKVLSSPPLKQISSRPPDNLEKFRKEISKLGVNYSPEPILVSKQSFKEEMLKSPASFANFTSPSAREIDFILENFRPNQTVLPSASVSLSSAKRFSFSAFLKKVFKKKIILSFVLIFAFSFGVFWNFKTKTDHLLQISIDAYSNMSKAQKSLNDLNLKEAFGSFALAAENFDLIQKELSGFSSVLGFLDDVTFGKFSEKAEIFQLTDLASQLGENFSYAFNKLSEVNFLSSIYKEKNGDFLENIKLVRLSLIKASRNLDRIGSILANIDYSLIPDSKRQEFLNFKSKIPELNEFLDKAINYSDIIMEILGQSEEKKYLLLFQNTSELRPTGGFLGSYGLIRFNKGIMEDFFVDDVYNPDGQIKENIIPPVQLQRITPVWGMRDANWFSDFPTSAKKVSEFYFKNTSTIVDGVIAVNVDVIPKILKITGPIEMPDFGIVLNSDNFLPSVQEEVEYKKTKGKPKQILVEFAPKFLSKLSSLDKEKWLEVFSIFVEALKEKDMMAYFSDRRLERFVLENNFGGEIKDIPGDYLMVYHTNIMGGKTDAVVDNFIDLKIEKDSEGNLIHTLTISRVHKGGDTPYGFYNRKSKDYVRILVPYGSELLSIKGNDKFDLFSYVDYQKEGFVFDPDLKVYEDSFSKSKGIDIFKESGKTGFGFWMITEPKKASRVVLKYKVPSPAVNSFYIQRQSGAKQKINVKVLGKTVIDDKQLNTDLRLESIF